MRIVLDTNVVVSALLWGGAPYRLIEAATAGDVELCTSPVLLTELRDVLGREHLASPGTTRGPVVADTLIASSEYSAIAKATEERCAARRDADDDHVIAAAVAAGADLIVTGDRPLLAVGTYQRARIVKVSDALRMLAP